MLVTCHKPYVKKQCHRCFVISKCRRTLAMPFAHAVCPRHLPTLFAHAICPRHKPTPFSHTAPTICPTVCPRPCRLPIPLLLGTKILLAVCFAGTTSYDWRIVNDHGSIIFMIFKILYPSIFFSSISSISKISIHQFFYSLIC